MSDDKSPVCSHCGYELDEDELWHGEYTVGHVNTGDQEDSELKCPNLDCGKVFHVLCVHEIRFIKTDEDGVQL